MTNDSSVREILNRYDFPDKFLRLYSVACTKYYIQKAKDNRVKVDERSLRAVEIAERFANGLASKDELAQAHTSAYAAYAAAYAAYAAASTAYAATTAYAAAVAYATAATAAATAYAAAVAAYAASATPIACKQILINMINELSELERILLRRAN